MRHKTKPRVLPIGSVSEGTLQAFDVIPELLSAADSVRMSAQDRASVRKLRREYGALPSEDVSWSRYGRPDGDEAAEAADEIWQELADILGHYAPDYCYFGSHEGDGSDIGVWPSWDSLEDDAVTRDRFLGANDPRTRYASVMKSADIPGVDVPAGFSHVLHVNDHGNSTLYRRAGTRWVECWAVV